MNDYSITRTPRPPALKDRGPWSESSTGKAFYPFAPRPEDFNVEDVAHALSNICRYGGHCTPNYSVAQHCVQVSYLVPPEHAVEGLWHDAGEAYLGDVIRPFKSRTYVLDLDGQLIPFSKLEDRVLACMATVFGFRFPFPASVHVADNVSMHDEAIVLMPPPPMPWVLPEPASGAVIEAWSHARAKSEFLRRHRELFMERYAPIRAA